MRIKNKNRANDDLQIANSQKMICRWSAKTVFFGGLICLLGLPTVAFGQPSTKLATTPETFSGVITEIKAGEISVRSEEGKAERVMPSKMRPPEPFRLPARPTTFQLTLNLQAKCR